MTNPIKIVITMKNIINPLYFFHLSFASSIEPRWGINTADNVPPIMLTTYEDIDKALK